jgi:GNAT superfamily N-acetyltransferase
MDYVIASKEDLPELARLRWEFRAEEDETPALSQPAFIQACTDFLERGLQTGNWIYWVAKEGNEIVSHLFIHTIKPVPRPCRPDDRFGYLTNVYTRPEFRNRGVGTELMKQARRWAEEAGLELVIVSPSEESKRFYRRAGFREETDFMQLRLREY